MKKIIIVMVTAIVITTIGLLYFLNLNNKDMIYKPSGKTEYEIVLIQEETNPYYQIGFSDYVFYWKGN